MKVSKREAEEIARKECESHGWPWEEPIYVSWGIFSYTVTTNARARGGNCRVQIRKRDGAIISSGFAPY